ncbi:MAG TPA: bifunctional hydroxymethylpyrimidine kinase/phosphomethylpyrimidine kinase [Chloroflexota bacterium]|nr:bifunctional hydroxymethylpyrimidine kinase/phosphomethylpyrimidine kinase [Chloroflexota bacterium]HUM69847.1 bifunctional hydroxymethylpyrimidine kinase/phosphomethylpyrimidine kinase [Chloroflexota bacterium]
MNKNSGKIPPKVLTIAGSDSGGAAGLQADLRTWAVLGAYGMSVVTAVTAQNSVSVAQVQYMSPELVTAQLDAVLSDYGAAAIKTGFIGQTELILVIGGKLQQYGCQKIVIDPVLVNHRGQPMFAEAVRLHYILALLPIAYLITPNVMETAVLLNSAVPDPTDLPRLAHLATELHRLGAKNVLLKGGRDGDEVVDIFFDGRTPHQLRSPYIETENTHGAGDTLSAAVCVALARGESLDTAVYLAHQFTYQAIQNGAYWQMGAGHGPVFPVIGNR